MDKLKEYQDQALTLCNIIDQLQNTVIIQNNNIHIWRITCGLLNVFLPDLYIKANSFDTALKIARDQDQRYDTGQIFNL